MSKSKDGSIFDSLEEAAYASRLIKSSLLSPDDKSEPSCQSAMAKIAMEIEACIFSFCKDGKTEEIKKNAIPLVKNIHPELKPVEKNDKDKKQNQETEKIDNKPEEEQDKNKNGNGDKN